MHTGKVGELEKPGWERELGLQPFADHGEPARDTIPVDIVSRDLRNQLPDQPFRREGGRGILVTVPSR